MDPTTISLSNKSFDNGAATKFAAYLSSLSNVTVADISDMIAGRPEDEALRTLNIICSSLKKFELEEVDLSDNALGAKGVTECIDVLQGASLKVCHTHAQKEKPPALPPTSPNPTLLHTTETLRVQQRSVCGGR